MRLTVKSPSPMTTSFDLILFARPPVIDEQVEEFSLWTHQQQQMSEQHGKYARCPSIDMRSCSFCDRHYGDPYAMRKLINKINSWADVDG